MSVDAEIVENPRSMKGGEAHESERRRLHLRFQNFPATKSFRTLAFAEAVATFGHLDAAFNNAGVQNVLAETADTTREDYDRIMGINLRGVWSCMKCELQQMRKQGSGTIVNCSSLGGLVGGAERGIYHAAKHGVLDCQSPVA
jgi:NAD(P)-dependent dehydrogenase (short-subunit alcohol dehydrogenase family)